MNGEEVYIEIDHDRLVLQIGGMWGEWFFLVAPEWRYDYFRDGLDEYELQRAREKGIDLRDVVEKNKDDIQRKYLQYLVLMALEKKKELSQIKKYSEWATVTGPSSCYIRDGQGYEGDVDIYKLIATIKKGKQLFKGEITGYGLYIKWEIWRWKDKIFFVREDMSTNNWGLEWNNIQVYTLRRK
ncbi:MAG: hypothetical protein J7J44_02900 [Deltaproteobacteria bacterium]|nr:hypothetical protein [Deltaproteobacteria bacterium]